MATSSLLPEVRMILDAARWEAARSVNAGMALAHWKISRAIVEREQAGKDRAGYGERLIETLSSRMAEKGMKGFSRNNLWYMRQFYLAYPEFGRNASCRAEGT